MNLNKSSGSILKSEEGLGFVESLIALLIAGMACVAFLSVASAVIRESANNAMRDSMNQYAVEGLEKVRLIADENITDIPVPTASDTEYYCLEADENCNSGVTPPPAPPPLVAISDMCAENSSECGTLKLSEGGSDMFYREIGIKQAGSNSVKVTVTVGFLVEGQGLARETKVVGFIGGVNI